MNRRCGSSKPTPTPLERSGYEARKNAKKVIEGNADTIRRQTAGQNLPRTASVAGGARRKRRDGKTNHRQNPPAVDYGFGPGGAPRPSARRANTPPRVPRPRPGPPTAATPAPAASSLPTVPIPFDRDRAEPVGTPLLRHTPPLGDTPPAPAKLDALGDAAKLQFADSVARYSHADWERQQQAEPTCHATRRYITIGRPSALPADFCRATLRTTDRLHRRMRIGAAHRELSRNHKERFFWHRTTLEPHARSGSAATATRCSPRKPAFGARATMACGGLKNQCEHDGGWGIPGPNFRRSGAVQAPSFPGALHDLRGGRTRFLVPACSRSQRVLSGGST